MEKKKLGLPSSIATGVGLILATSCLLVIGQGTGDIGTSFIFSMMIAVILNALTALSVSELDSMMPQLTGGLAQYSMVSMGPFLTETFMVGGYIVGMTVFGSLEGTMFGRTMEMLFPDLNIPLPVYGIALVLIIVVLNCRGIDMFAKVQNFVAYTLIISLIIMGIIGCLYMGKGDIVVQDTSFNASLGEIMALVGTAFYMFVGCEFVVPLSPYVKNPKRDIPGGMIGSLIVVFKMPKVPRNFKVPGGIVLPVIGAIGDIYMIYGISNDVSMRNRVFIVCLIMLIILVIYSLIWVKKVMKKPLFCIDERAII